MCNVMFCLILCLFVCFDLFCFVFSLACHVVEVEVRGPGPDGNNFAVKISRTNPAASGNVTGKQTFVSLLSSIKGEPKIEM